MSLSPTTFGLNVIGDAFYYILFLIVSNDSDAANILAIIGGLFFFSLLCYGWHLFIISLHADDNKANSIDIKFCTKEIQFCTIFTFIVSFVAPFLFWNNVLHELWAILVLN